MGGAERRTVRTSSPDAERRTVRASSPDTERRTVRATSPDAERRTVRATSRTRSAGRCVRPLRTQGAGAIAGIGRSREEDGHAVCGTSWPAGQTAPGRRLRAPGRETAGLPHGSGNHARQSARRDGREPRDGSPRGGKPRGGQSTQPAGDGGRRERSPAGGVRGGYRPRRRVRRNGGGSGGTWRRLGPGPRAGRRRRRHQPANRQDCPGGQAPQADHQVHRGGVLRPGVYFLPTPLWPAGGPWCSGTRPSASRA